MYQVIYMNNDMNNNLKNINDLYITKKYIDQVIEEITTRKNFDDMINKYEHFEEILGPSGLILYELNNKYVFLLQDVHIKPTKKCKDVCKLNPDGCVWINTFLKDLFLVSPFCIDYFHETITFLQIPTANIGKSITKHTYNAHVYGLKHQKEIGLSETMKEFANCLGPVKKGCKKYKRTRFHNIEFRRFIKNDYDFDAFRFNNIFVVPFCYMYNYFDIGSIKTMNLQKLVDSKNKNDIDITKYDNKMKLFLDSIDKYKDMFNYLLSGDMDKLSQTILDLFGQFVGPNITHYIGDWKKHYEPNSLKLSSPYPKLNKQFSQFDKTWKKILKKYIMTQFNAKVSQYFIAIQTEKINLDNAIANAGNISNHMHNIITYLYGLHFAFSVIVFDSYTIARVMKSILVYPDSSVIMIYAGAAHTGTYKKLFRYLHQTKKISLVKHAHIGNYRYGSNDGCINTNEHKSGWANLIKILRKLNNETQTCDINTGIKL